MVVPHTSSTTRFWSFIWITQVKCINADRVAGGRARDVKTHKQLSAKHAHMTRCAPRLTFTDAASPLHFQFPPMKNFLDALDAVELNRLDACLNMPITCDSREMHRIARIQPHLLRSNRRLSMKMPHHSNFAQSAADSQLSCEINTFQGTLVHLQYGIDDSGARISA